MPSNIAKGIDRTTIVYATALPLRNVHISVELKIHRVRYAAGRMTACTKWDRTNVLEGPF
jgi:hypothetical protein